MLRLRQTFWRADWFFAFIAIVLVTLGQPALADITSEKVERAIRNGVRYLKGKQGPDGSWGDVDQAARTGPTSLAVLALLTAGEKPGTPTIQRALAHLRQFGPDQLNSTYSISLQTMAFAAAEPERDRNRILANVEVLERGRSNPATG